ncbi:MFS transporter [Propionibacterium freudenreichii]|uniref:MFS transporter n=1 Tax=Propionibacterium freudenreichii TaxID=1744 RepID=UPI0021A2D8EF|nr:MFS transporter [Propionibacterium freudenreichii]MCT2981482.1 MFS transporter [Propionibacterium freudenreichii]
MIDTLTHTPRTTTRHTTVLVSAVITQLMIVLDLTVVAIALPHMQADLAMTTTQRPWVVTAYSLAFGGLVLFGGRLIDVLGLRRAYRIGLIGFAAASLGAGLAPSFSVLVVARAIQGGFGALLAPTLMALVNVTFPRGAGRGRAFAVLGATAGVGAAAGLLIGGALTDSLGWRWCLYVNVAIAAVAFVVGLRSLPPTVRHGSRSHATDDALGLLLGCGAIFSFVFGLLLGCGAIFSFVFGLNQAEQHDWTTPSTLAWLGAGAVLGICFVVREARAATPILPLWLLSSPARAAAYLTQFSVGAAQMGAILYLTYYFQGFLGYSPLRTGVAFLPMAGALMVTAVFAGRFLVARLGARGLLPLGLAVQAVAFVVFTGLTVDSSYAQVALPSLMIFGVGEGLTMPVVFNAGTRGVPDSLSGLASATLGALQQIGSSFGVALLAAYATHATTNYATSRAAALKADIAGALAQAHATPTSPAGQDVVHQLTNQLANQLANQAQLSAYSGGFALLAWLAGGAAVLLAIGALVMWLHRTQRS